MKLTLTITTLLLACAAWGQTNETSLFGLSDLENTAGWNFVEEAKNLTAEEKNSFNLMAGDGRGFLGRWHIDAIAANVRRWMPSGKSRRFWHSCRLRRTRTPHPA